MRWWSCGEAGSCRGVLVWCGLAGRVWVCKWRRMYRAAAAWIGSPTVWRGARVCVCVCVLLRLVLLLLRQRTLRYPAFGWSLHETPPTRRLPPQHGSRATATSVQSKIAPSSFRGGHANLLWILRLGKRRACREAKVQKFTADGMDVIRPPDSASLCFISDSPA